MDLVYTDQSIHGVPYVLIGLPLIGHLVLSTHISTINQRIDLEYLIKINAYSKSV